MANAGILDPLKNILDKTPVVQDVSDVLGKPVAVNEITDLVGNLVDAVEGLTNPATDLVDNTVNSLTDTTNGLLDGTVGDVTDTVNNVLNDTTDTVNNVLNDTTGTVTVTVTVTVTDVIDTLSKVLDSTGITDVVGGIVNTTTDNGVFNQGTTQPAETGKQKVTVMFKVGDPMLYVNGQALGKMDVIPYIKQSRCFLPVRYVAYSLGLKPKDVFWDPSSMSVTLKGVQITEKLFISKKTLYVNEKQTQMDIFPEIVNPGRVMLPYRWVAEGFGATVKWDPQNSSVTIEYYL